MLQSRANFISLFLFMKTETEHDVWDEFLTFIKGQISKAEFENWFKPISKKQNKGQNIVLSVPNIFVREYILENYKKEMMSFLPTSSNGDLLIDFVIAEAKKSEPERIKKAVQEISKELNPFASLKLNSTYQFNTFIEGSANQYVKSAAFGVANRPGKTYNPLFIHGGVGLGKTHILHSIGHYALEKHKNIRIQCITTEAFINDLVDSLRNKSSASLKRYYRSLDLLLVDDIQFLQSRLNFEEEFCTMFEALINQHKQIVITSDKPPSELNLSERLVARMEWGLVANVGIPDLETRVAILQSKAEKKGVAIPSKVAFFIAEHIFNNVRQLEGAINRLSAYTSLMKTPVTQELVEKSLADLFQYMPKKSITVESILKSVSSMFNVRVQDLQGTKRNKDIAFPRQVAMYLAKELINESYMKLASSFGGKTHSTLLHSWKKIDEKIKNDERLARQIQMTKNNLEK